LACIKQNGIADGAGRLRRPKEANVTVFVLAANASKLGGVPTKNTGRTLRRSGIPNRLDVRKVTQSGPVSGA